MFDHSKCYWFTKGDEGYLIWFENGHTFSTNGFGTFDTLSLTSLKAEDWIEKFSWISSEPFCVIIWLRCAECDKISYLDYLCHECRNNN